ncbi:5-formyltetrahydrofolate cyclo-ligase [Kaistia algarum]|uniref:5-formyltetrahydrofolate cyclo-ligase n=1 Tax=Kaistia algarum TaxID=2083279 RepID=UPI000CE7703C|nr:5-formyltetrahydrofolate cyclo-ligase [Kaistia algarum]MCX5516362.1 5-formyltetrahydrofolate cyclo-ligase [Kaistia algarum]PPE78722.1 5-formyltetrahydrofolate cyclo-ligase [Kaistia algarum]
MRDLPNLKADLRATALARRDAIDVSLRQDAAEAAAVHSAPLLARLSPRIVSGYWPIRSEVDPQPILAAARRAGASIALPVLVDRATLRFRLHEADEPLVPAGFGTYGPPETAPEIVPDLVILPLAAFDRALHRIGYGQGHYDRALAAMIDAGRRPCLVGLAFAAQEVERIPFEPHDIPLDFIVTERELIAAPSRG